MSFHESVGLLAICDAIETVEAAASSSSTSTSSSSPSPPPLLPPLVAAHSKQQKQKQKQKQSQKLLFGRYFHRPAKHSHYALKMSSNQASTANNNNNSDSSSSSSSSPSADGAVNPAAVDAPPAHLSVADLAGMAARERLHDNSAIDPSFLPIDPAIAPMAPADYTASAAAYPSLLSTLAGESAFHTIRRQPVQSQPKRRPQHQSPYDNSMAHQPQHTQHRHQPPQPQHTSQQQHHQPQQQHQQQQTNQSSIPPEHRSEECHICGRIFRGAKSSTHKQQHIRRLHPDDYQPKRGGKKRAAAAAAAAAAIAATASSGMTSPTPVSSSSHSGTPSGSSASVSLPVMHDYRSFDNSANDDSDESRRRVRPKTEVAVPVDPAIIVADMASESTAALQPSESNVAAALSEFNSSQQPKQENN
ncbi:hypothetical protein BZA70DRAFT_267102 [Myxozyma melibiosi]|uniref:C2H2-type domain-containing protein n=1 Tax=Myxozyma melibiosi TaxID=54550 RepID=A0ABR1F822_9ASCO